MTRDAASSLRPGPEPSLFKSKHHCIRLHYLVNGQGGYFHMFRSTGTRFFNNVAVAMSSEEETIESLKAICESFKVALSVKSLNVPLFEGKLERRRSKLPFVQQGDRGPLPRNVSEGQLMAFVNVGSRALSNVTSQFARLNPMRSVRVLAKRPGAALGTLGALGALGALAEATPPHSFQGDSSSDSEEDTARWLRGQVPFSPGPFGPGPFSHVDCSLGSDYSSDSDEQVHQGQDTLLASCGILATSPSLGQVPPQGLDVDHFVLEAMRRSSARRMPQIQVTWDQQPSQSSREPPPLPSLPSLPQLPSLPTAARLRHFSKSSEQLEPSEFGQHLMVRQETPREEGSKMKMSHSESAIQDFSGALPLSSPIVIKKDLVLSPLSRIAKGVQTLGLNLRPVAMGDRKSVV